MSRSLKVNITSFTFCFYLWKVHVKSLSLFRGMVYEGLLSYSFQTGIILNKSVVSACKKTVCS